MSRVALLRNWLFHPQTTPCQVLSMRKPNFSKLSTEVLEKYLKDIETQLAKRAKDDQKRAKAVAKLQAMAKAQGIDINDVIGTASKPVRKRQAAGKKVAATRGKVAPPYRNPKNASETWNGRGRKPKWVEAFLKS
ncbi:MAG: H-NS histone family protein, partial [Pseudomonadota bacterium]